MYLLLSCFEFVVEFFFFGIKFRLFVFRFFVLFFGFRLGEVMLLLWIVLFGEDWGDICLVLLFGDVREYILLFVILLW